MDLQVPYGNGHRFRTDDPATGVKKRTVEEVLALALLVNLILTPNEIASSSESRIDQKKGLDEGVTDAERD